MTIAASGCCAGQRSSVKCKSGSFVLNVASTCCVSKRDSGILGVAHKVCASTLTRIALLVILAKCDMSKELGGESHGSTMNLVIMVLGTRSLHCLPFSLQ